MKTNNLFLGIDTSNYTTSISIVSENGEIIADIRKPLKVKEGMRGLRQQEAFFQHVNELPSLYQEALIAHKINTDYIKAVCVSSKPKNVQDSYMPCFLAGLSIGKVIANTLNVPIYETSHQEGHIKAIDKEIDLNKDEFIVFHISGGTCELLDVKREKGSYKVKEIGGSLDISFGQLIDRVGVACGFSFPSGKEMDKRAYSFKSNNKINLTPIKTKGLFFNLSGIETQVMRELEKENIDLNNIAFSVLSNISICINKIIDNLDKPVVFVGGVSESKFLRKSIQSKNKVFFGSHGSDNAIGTAYIGGELWQLNR